MSIEDFKGLMDGFDPATLLPNLDAVDTPYEWVVMNFPRQA